MIAPALLAALAGLLATPAMAEDSASEGLALCRLQGLDPGKTHVVWSAGPLPEADAYLAEKKPNLELRTYDRNGYMNFREVVGSFAFALENYPDGKHWQSVNNDGQSGGLFLYDTDIRDRGDGGVYGTSLAEYVSKPSAFTCAVIAAHKVCPVKKVRAFYQPCEG